MEIKDNPFINEENKLSVEDMELVPVIAAGLRAHIGKANQIKTENILKGLLKNTGTDITEIKLRSIIRYIRHRGIVPCVMSSGGGYWVANSLEECLATIGTFEKKRYSEYYTELRLIQQVQERYDVDIMLIDPEDADPEDDYNTVLCYKDNPS